MLSSNLSNFISRSTRVTAINEDGEVYKILPNAKINFLQDIESLKKQAALSIRLHKDEPMHNVERITLRHAGEDVLLTPEVLDELKTGKRAIEFTSAAEKFNVTIYIKNKDGETIPTNMRLKTANRPRSASRRSAEEQENAQQAHPNSSNVPITNQLKAPSTPQQVQPPSPIRVRPNSATRRRNVASPAVIRRAMPLHAPTTPAASTSTTSARSTSEIVHEPKAPVVVHTRMSPQQNAAKLSEDVVLSSGESNEITSISIDIKEVDPDLNENDLNITGPVDNDIDKEPAIVSISADVALVQELKENTSNAVSSEVVNESDINLIWREVPAVPGAYTPSPMRPCDSRAITPRTPVNVTASVQRSNMNRELTAEVAMLAAESLDADDDGVENQSDEDNYDGECEHSPMPTQSQTLDLDGVEATPIKQTPVKSRTTRSIKRSASKISVQERTPMQISSAESLYPEGRTAAEVGRAYTTTMRSYEHHGTNHQPRSARKASMTTPGKSAKKEPKKDSEPEGRPSLGTLTMQWQFMRANFLKGDEDELEWLMVSKKPGAYKHAHKKYCAAEDKYYRSLCETELTEKQLQVLAGPGKKLLEAINSACSIHLSLQVTPTNEDVMNQALAMQEIVRQLLFPAGAATETSSETPALLTIFSANTQKTLSQLCEESNRIRIARIGNSLDKVLSDEAKELPTRLKTIQHDGDEALKDMEKWSKREVETDDYLECMKEMELEWFAKEEAANREALNIMRTFIPIGIADMTTDTIQERIAALGGLYSLELITELKKNKCLHWITYHRDDIAMANFLAGEAKQYFENIESYDIIELRALVMCLPDKFELDGDGKKAEWRTRIMNRTKLLASQQNRESVKGSWDIKIGKRQMVTLPPLKQEQERRSVYYYRTKVQCDLKLKQYIEKENLLKKKTDLLKSAELEAMDNKKEYDTILVEMRDPDFKAIYGAEKLVALKEVAKTEWTKSETKRKQLLQDVNRIQKAILDNPISREQFEDSMVELDDFLAARNINWKSESNPVLIIGVFDPSIEIIKTERVATKFLSAEEEAEIRKAELSKITAKKADDDDDANPTTVCTDHDTTISEVIPGKLPASSLCFSSSEHPVEISANNFTPGRRGSILANKEFLSSLNKMLSGTPGNNQLPFGSPTPRTPSSRMSLFSAGPAVAATTTPSTRRASVASTEAVPLSIDNLAQRTQSKLLKKALETQSVGTKVEAEDQPARKPLSFLEQIKLGKKKTDENSSEAGNETPTAAPLMKPSMSALFGGAGASGGAPSFLDAIRARKKD